MVRLSLTVPAPGGLNWIVRDWVFRGASENETGPPTSVNAEPLTNCSTVPVSIPRPVFPMVTVLLVMLPCTLAIETRAGLESLPGITIALSAMLTFGCFGSPLMIGILCVAIPSASGLNAIAIGILPRAVSVYCPVPVPQRALAPSLHQSTSGGPAPIADEDRPRYRGHPDSDRRKADLGRHTQQASRWFCDRCGRGSRADCYGISRSRIDSHGRSGSRCRERSRRRGTVGW